MRTKYVIWMAKYYFYIELDYSVAQRPHKYIYVSPGRQKISIFPALDPMPIGCYALPHTSACQISKESTMFPESRPYTDLLYLSCIM
jgi:hypothetical protein